MTHTYQISGMTCGNCVAKVRSELLKLGDVITADVQLGLPQATLEMSNHISTSALQQAISKAGNYQISEIKSTTDKSAHESEKQNNNSYFPIILIFGYITLISVLIQVVKGSFSWLQWMNHFMAGFFFIFSFFKFLNLRGFAEGYGTYDILAKRFSVWGYFYPFVELIFAVLLILEIQPIATNLAVFLVMAISSVGVIQSLLRKSKIQCACLGTVIQLPLGTVTLVEDLLMVVMSIGMVIAMG